MRGGSGLREEKGLTPREDPTRAPSEPAPQATAPTCFQLHPLACRKTSMSRLRRSWALLGLTLALLPTLGARHLQGPIWGVVETSDGRALDDIVVRLRCAAHLLHGASASDYETRIVATGERFLFAWAWGGLSPVGCSVRVHHPLYRSGYAPVGDDFANDLGTITLQSFDEFLSAGPTDPPLHSAYPWPQLELQEHLGSAYQYFALEHPEKGRAALAQYAPALNDIFERCVERLPTSLHDDNPTIGKLREQLLRYREVTGWQVPPAQLALADAVRDGDAARTRELLAAGVDPDGYDDEGNSPLHIAVLQNHLKLVEILLDAGADIDRPRTGAGDTPLLEAVQHHQDDAALLLLARGADPTYTAWRGPALQAAIQQNARPDVVDALIEHGAIQKARDPRHVVALFQTAARGGKSAILRKLVAAGAPADLASESGYTALMGAARKGHVEAARTLIELGAHVNARDRSGKTALSEAREHGHDNVIALLEEHGARPADGTD
jgi:ankyrin repeat protein